MLTRGVSRILSGAPKTLCLHSKIDQDLAVASARGAAVPFVAPGVAPGAAPDAAPADDFEAPVAPFKLVEGIRWVYIRNVDSRLIGVDAASPRCAAAAVKALRDVKPNGTLGGPTCFFQGNRRHKTCRCETKLVDTSLDSIDDCLKLPADSKPKIRDILDQDPDISVVITIPGTSKVVLDTERCVAAADSHLPTEGDNLDQFCSDFGWHNCECRYPIEYKDVERFFRGDEKVAFFGANGAAFLYLGAFAGNPEMLVPYQAMKDADAHSAAEEEVMRRFKDKQDASRLRGRGWIAADPDNLGDGDVRDMSEALMFKKGHLVVPPSKDMFMQLRKAIDGGGGGGDGVVAGGMFAPIKDGEEGGASSDDGAIDVSAFAAAILAAAGGGGGGGAAAGGAAGGAAAAGDGGDATDSSAVEEVAPPAAGASGGNHGVLRSRKWVVIDSEGFRSTDTKCAECVAATNQALDEIGPDGILAPTCAYLYNTEKPCNCEVIAEEWSEVGDAFCTGDEVLVTFRFARRPDMRAAYHASQRCEEAARWVAAGLEPCGASYLCSEDDEKDDATTFKRGVQQVAAKKRRAGGGAGGGEGAGEGAGGGNASKKARKGGQ